MDAESGRQNSTLEDKLFNEPYRFEFFQAVKLLERLYPDSIPVGRVDKEGIVPAPDREVARFKTRPSLQFPPSQIYELKYVVPPSGVKKDDSLRLKATILAPPQMEVPFMGLTGPLGVLPVAYTELVMSRIRGGNRTLYDFLDMFNHRMISFFYRAWEKYRFPVTYERNPNNNEFTSDLFSLIGFNTNGVRNKLSIKDESLLRYAGLIAQSPRSASAIIAIVIDYFDVPARIEQFFGQWLEPPQDELTLLGRNNTALGISTVAGKRVWDVQSKFRIKLGALTYEQFSRFLPKGSAFNQIMDLVCLLVGTEFDFDIQLILKSDEVPSTVISNESSNKSMLGWNTWLKTKPFITDDSQVVFCSL